MNPNALFIEQVQIVPFIMPQALNTAANTGDWVDMSLYRKLTLIFICGVGAASQDPTITLNQATSNAGANTKALTAITRVDVKQASALTAVAQFTTVTQAAANTYTSDTAGECQKVWVVDIDADMLDVDGAFRYVQCSIADVGTATQIGAVLGILWSPRYSQTPMLGAIA